MAAAHGLVGHLQCGCILLASLWIFWNCVWLLHAPACPPPPVEAPADIEEPFLLPPPPADPGALAAALYNYIELPQRWCRKLVMVGGQIFHRGGNGNGGGEGEGEGEIDGHKFICLDEPITPVAPCIVYSFGSRDEWSFERAVISQFGCEVHTFDPSLSVPPRDTHGAVFHPLGLAGTSRTSPQGWELATLRDIRAKLGHLNRLIAYLKVDIEGSEWEWLESEAENLEDVLQIGMEVHIPVAMSNKALLKVYNVFRRLQAAGFRTVFSEVNRVWGRDKTVQGVRDKVGMYYEMVWVKVT